VAVRMYIKSGNSPTGFTHRFVPVYVIDHIPDWAAQIRQSHRFQQQASSSSGGKEGLRWNSETTRRRPRARCGSSEWVV
jgi:hypothetical protein